MKFLRKNEVSLSGYQVGGLGGSRGGGALAKSLPLALLTLTMALAASQNVPALIAALSDANNATRAEALAEKLAADPSLPEEMITARSS